MPEETLARRAFYLTFIYSLWGLITAALAIPAAIYLLIPAKSNKRGNWLEVGDLDRLSPQQPEELVYRRTEVDGWKVSSVKSTVWAVKQADNRVVVFSPRCTHLGCAYHWDEAHHYFLCPCHTSIFSINGAVLSGPAPRPLDRYAVKLVSGKILIGALEKSSNVA
jgi:quinol---cytochrome c reductase iron-sulfur subunit, bacillus type